MTNSVIMVVPAVSNVRERVWLTESLINAREMLPYLPRFSRMRSNTTIVSTIE